MFDIVAMYVIFLGKSIFNPIAISKHLGVIRSSFTLYNQVYQIKYLSHMTIIILAAIQ